MCRTIEWPDYDKEELFQFNKVINETDFLPLHFVRVLVQETKLLRMQRGKLVLTRLGKEPAGSQNDTGPCRRFCSTSRSGT